MKIFQSGVSGGKTTSRLAQDRIAERGSVLAEFVMVAPVMLLLAGSALRFYQELQAQQIGLTLAREVASLAYSRCIDKTHTTIGQDSNGQEQVTGDAQETLNQIGVCVNEEVIDQFKTNWDSVKPSAAGPGAVNINVKAYRCNIEQISSTSCAQKGEVICNSSSDTCQTNTDASFPTLTALRNRMIVATIKFDMAPLALFIPSISPRTVTYEATI
jgi:hypothetical protein